MNRKLIKVEEIDSNGFLTYHNYTQQVFDIRFGEGKINPKYTKITYRDDGSVLVDHSWGYKK